MSNADGAPEDKVDDILPMPSEGLCGEQVVALVEGRWI